jgi:hypothetical protein
MSRPCTCHPDDIRPEPCPQRYAYGECVKAAFDERAKLRAALEEIADGNAASCKYCQENTEIAHRALEEK